MLTLIDKDNISTELLSRNRSQHSFVKYLLNIGKNIQTYTGICYLACDNCQAIHQLVVLRSPPGGGILYRRVPHQNSVISVGKMVKEQITQTKK